MPSLRKRNSWFLLFLVVVAIVVIFLEPSYGWKVRAWLGPTFLRAADEPNSVAENEALKAQLAVLQSVAAQLPQISQGYLRAMVYSRYPFNFKNEMLVNAGADQGVSAGKAVVFQGILIGVVERVFKDTALVQTVFDGNFKMPVRVGARGYDALLVGGAYPKAASLEKDASVATGTIVYSAAEGLPFGMPVAIVAGTSTSPDTLFEEAMLSFAYDVNGIQTVNIQK